jgi:hypothetical protein
MTIQKVAAQAMKKRPKPTGLPQLNQLPHERQFFIDQSAQSSFERVVLLSAILFFLY